MSRLAVSGVQLDFSIDADVAAIFQSRILVFQCKRSQTLKAVSGKIKTASAQLKKSSKAIIRSQALGLIALDLTKAVNPQLQVPTYESRDHLEKWLNSKLVKLGINLRNVHSVNTGTNANCLVIRIREVALIPTLHGADPYACELWAILPFLNNSSQAEQILSNLSTILSPNW